MIEVALTACFFGIYLIGGLATFFVEAFRLRGKEFSNEYTSGMHYTNEEAVEMAAFYALIWPAYLLGLTVGAIGKFVASID